MGETRDYWYRKYTTINSIGIMKKITSQEKIPLNL